MSDTPNHYWVETSPPATVSSEYSCANCNKAIKATKQTRRFFKIQNPRVVNTTGVPVRAEVNTTYHNCKCVKPKTANTPTEEQIEEHTLTGIKCCWCGARLYMRDRPGSAIFADLLPCNCTRVTRVIESDQLPLS